jgi:hypothetical protein
MSLDIATVNDRVHLFVKNLYIKNQHFCTEHAQSWANAAMLRYECQGTHSFNMTMKRGKKINNHLSFVWVNLQD